MRGSLLLTLSFVHNLRESVLHVHVNVQLVREACVTMVAAVLHGRHLGMISLVMAVHGSVLDPCAMDETTVFALNCAVSIPCSQIGDHTTCSSVGSSSHVVGTISLLCVRLSHVRVIADLLDASVTLAIRKLIDWRVHTILSNSGL